MMLYFVADSLSNLGDKTAGARSGYENSKPALGRWRVLNRINYRRPTSYYSDRGSDPAPCGMGGRVATTTRHLLDKQDNC
ncbi:hypothetical protein RRG08_020841 [Elysia crispata]|uniref:Uncharacterized protein n=1 Tax=Elysia crispata TaxID=231223 RepID=A0AAE0XUQ1_9GAST|nr:hypothetical protein RRG08_020841 [Elysia crispata]